MEHRLNNLLLRSLSTIVLLPLCLAVVYYGGWMYNLGLTLIGIIIVLEWYNIAIAHRKKLRINIALWCICFILYSTLLMLMLFLIRHYGGIETTLLLLSLCWAHDLGGYVVGNLLKGKKLAPKISPNKTWSGFFGGIIFSYIISKSIVYYFSLNIRDLHLVIGGTLAQFGDLLESSIKRYFNVKDSGRIIPGHGGVLDRIDSFFFTSIYFVIVIFFLG